MLPYIQMSEMLSDPHSGFCDWSTHFFDISIPRVRKKWGRAVQKSLCDNSVAVQLSTSFF